MCFLIGLKNLEGLVDFFIVYLDVWWMLFIQKVFIEGNWLLMYYLVC